MATMPTLAPDAEITDVRTALLDGTRVLLELRATPVDKRGDTFAADAKEAIDFLHDTNLIHDALERSGRVEAPTPPAGESRGPRGAFTDSTEARSLGDQLVSQDGYTSWAERGGRNSGGAYAGEVRNLLGEYTSGGYVSGAAGWLPVATPQMVTASLERRRPFVRDLMSVQSTGLKVIPYLREQAQITNETGAAMTSEGSAKQEVTMTFEQYSAIVEKITAWIPATDEILTDAPTLKGYIDTRLEYMLMIREEAQVLAGSGTSPQIQGLATLPGTQPQSAVSGDYPATIGKAIGLVENVDGEADGVVTNAVDYWTAVVKRHTDMFDNGYGGNAPAAASGITWGLPVVRTRAITSGNAWVASWRLGSTLFDRQETTIKVGDQHSDYFLRNLLVILAEKRIAVAWHRPNCFVKTTVPTS